MVPVFRVNALNHFKSLFGSNRFYSVYPRSFLPLIVLRDPTHCEHASCPGLHQQLLQFLDCSLITTLFSSKDALLYPVHMLLKLAPGQLAPTLTLRVQRVFSLGPGCLRICHTTCASFFHVTVLTSAYPGHYPRRLLLRQSFRLLHVVGTCSLYRPPARGNRWFLRSDCSFGAPCRRGLSTGLLYE